MKQNNNNNNNLQFQLQLQLQLQYNNNYLSIKGVLDCDFVDRGRQVVSASRDSSAILHDVPTQNVIHRCLFDPFYVLYCM